MNQHARHYILILLSALSFASLAPYASAQDNKVAQPQFIDPSDLYFEAWLKIRDAEKLTKEEHFLDAYEKYQSAQKIFGTISSYHPEWKAEMVATRIGSTQKSIDGIQEKAAAEKRGEQSKIQALYIEGSNIDVEEDPGGLISPNKIIPIVPDTPEIKSSTRPSSKRSTSPVGNNNNQAELLRLHREIKTLRNQLQAANKNRDANSAKLRKTINKLEAERSKYAGNTVRNEVTQLNSKIRRIEQERDTMALALKKSRLERNDKDAELAKLQLDKRNAEKATKDTQQKLQLERQTNNSLVDGLRRQLKTFQAELNDKNSKIIQLQTRVTDLETQHQQSLATITELKQERDTLLNERLQLTELLKLNDSDRVQKLIEQKVQLASQLRELREANVKLLNSDNTAKNELLSVQTNLAYVKKQMINLQEENTEQTQRLADLTQRLKEAREDLDKQPLEQSSPQSNEEVILLKDIINRQLAIQKRQKIYKDILIERTTELSVSDELRAPIENLLGEKLVLSEQEQKLLENAPAPDGEFFNPGAAPAAVRQVAGAKLRDKISASKRVAARAYAAKRYQASREVYEIILEDSPGDVDSLCKLGVVNIALGDLEQAEQSFRNAVTMNEKTAFAHYGLGTVFFKLGRDAEATPALQRTLELHPKMAEAHVLLGNISGKFKDIESAENHFNTAVKINPTLSEPVLNLAIIKANSGQLDQARTFYDQAIENGALPNASLEKLLRK